MRLLRTATLRIEIFSGEHVPPYAILSHTWGDEEISFQDLQEVAVQSSLSAVKRRVNRGETLQSIKGPKRGILKIVGCALQAEKDGLGYIWCDTCCIDKRDSSELSEAINSMYSWYKGRSCYAYLSDVPHSVQADRSTQHPAFIHSRWFTRGWTLQELIAPATIMFFDEGWTPVGTRSEFKNLIAEKTGIRVGVLEGESPTQCSIAERMSWAAHRQTTRAEDIAYCLMGLFQVYMPLIYGEKEKAFLRLQNEIMNKSEDQSLFAWKSPSIIGEAYCGLLAPSPAYFADCRTVRDAHHNMNKPPYAMTSRGISIYLSLYRIRYVPRAVRETKAGVFFAPLACVMWDKGSDTAHLGIYLTQNRNGTYNRCYPHLLVSDYDPDAEDLDQKTVYIAQDEVIDRCIGTWLYRFRVPELPPELTEQGLIMRVFFNKRIGSWNGNDRILTCYRGLGASIYIGTQSGKGLVLLVGVDSLQMGRCAFDDASDTASQSFVDYGPDPKNALDFAPALLQYRSDSISKPGPFEEQFFDQEFWDHGSSTTEITKQLSSGSQRLRIDQVKRERRRYWDEWISRPRNQTGSLHFETSAVIMRTKPRFYQKKFVSVRQKIQRTLYTSIKAEGTEGQCVFVLSLGI